MNKGDPTVPAIPEEHWQCIQEFQRKLGCIQRETCEVCNETAFDSDVRIKDGMGICRRCRTHRDKATEREGGAVDHFSAANDMDPGPIPDDLPPLSIAAELLIARISRLDEFLAV